MIKFDPVVLEGRGDDVIDVVIPGDAPAVLTIEHTGPSNFAVWSYDAQGNQLDLLVNEIGNYSGRLPINLYVGEEVAELEITAGGTWRITGEHITEAEVFAGSYVGSGDDVLLFAAAGTRMKVTHNGQSNFVVRTHGSFPDLLVNEIGNYAGTVRLESEVVLIEVRADGDWTLEID